MSSLESVHYYDSEDWQLLKTDHSYESSKYQMDLIGTQLDKQVTTGPGKTTSPANIRHFVVQPGVAHTGIIDLLIIKFMQYFMLLAFYMASLLHASISLQIINEILGKVLGIPTPCNRPDESGGWHRPRISRTRPRPTKLPTILQITQVHRRR